MEKLRNNGPVGSCLLRKDSADTVYSGGKLDIREQQMAETRTNYPISNPGHC